MKRCARCLLVQYCSKECQRLSWKATHKQNCRIHPSRVSSDDPNKQPPKSENPMEIITQRVDDEIDRTLFRWLEAWRDCFRHWAVISLDLANHPPDRVVTHCMQLIIERAHFDFSGDPAKQYKVVEGSVVAISDVKAQYPDLVVNIDPTNFSFLRWVIILRDPLGGMWKLRMHHWHERRIGLFRQMGKEMSAGLSGEWALLLRAAVNSARAPAAVMKMLNGERPWDPILLRECPASLVSLDVI
ncbi:hypothetical protein LshimejAT787_0100490 [Lyophyllum shimeji]|uniref:MYND-type domain-containing protein n=1 Tax=Lyophyllum shimeji TaxID=47721 RepID=A0A9P3PCY2_LYOSH|nr:hypothetical protein LshimejAT787_0100490 [Lyophyllum shimeji]